MRLKFSGSECSTIVSITTGLASTVRRPAHVLQVADGHVRLGAARVQVLNGALDAGATQRPPGDQQAVSYSQVQQFVNIERKLRMLPWLATMFRYAQVVFKWMHSVRPYGGMLISTGRRRYVGW